MPLIGKTVLVWSCDGRLLLLLNGVVRRRIRALGVVPGRGMGDAQHSSMADQQVCPNQLFCGRPIIPLKGTSAQRRELAMGVLLWWASLGLTLSYEKGSFGPEAVWVGTHLVINAKANKVEIRLSAKKNSEIPAILLDLMDGPGSTIKHDEVRKLAGNESWVASFLPQLKPFVKQFVGQYFQAVHW